MTIPENAVPELHSAISATGRFFRILQDAVQKGGERSFLEVWGEVLGTDPADRTKAYQLLGDFFGLLELAKVEISAHPELKQSLYLGTLEGIEAILVNAHHHSPWNGVLSQLAGSNLRALEFCADQLDRLSLEKEIPQSYLDIVQREVEAVIADLLASSLEQEAKQALIMKLEDVRAAILAYRLRGLDGLRLTTQSAVGALVMSYPRLQRTSKLDIVTKVLDLLVKLATLVEKANLLMPGSGSAIRAMLGPGASSSGTA